MKAATADKASTEATQAHQDQQSSSSATTPPAIHTPRHQGQVTNRKTLCHLRVHFRGLSRMASEVASFTRRQQAPAVIARPRGLVTAITSHPACGTGLTRCGWCTGTGPAHRSVWSTKRSSRRRAALGRGRRGRRYPGVTDGPGPLADTPSTSREVGQGTPLPVPSPRDGRVHSAEIRTAGAPVTPVEPHEPVDGVDVERALQGSPVALRSPL